MQQKELHEQITNIIIKQLEKGVTPWRKPFEGGEALRLPVNGTTNKQYNGINILLLWASAMDAKYHTNEWGSFKQWAEKKELVKKGEKGSMIVYYDTIERPDKDHEGEVKKIPYMKFSYVFNKEQLQSYKPSEDEAQVHKPLPERIEKADEFVRKTGAIIEHGKDGAYYVPSTDKIHMPDMDKFHDMPDCKAAEAYYATLFHEIIHMTGHPSRLDRKINNKYGSEKYAQEELVAELGSAFLAAEHDIEKAPVENHAAYISGWMKALKEEPGTVIVASSQASKAVNYLYEHQR